MRACGSLFPYGKTFEPARCVTGEGQARAAGSRKGCRSRAGVYDLSGNVAEWVEEGAAMGGDYSASGAAASCTSRSSGGAVGYRCCSELEDDWD
jgi:formylglycine-generating enzyme required for sulfatase activity